MVTGLATQTVIAGPQYDTVAKAQSRNLGNYYQFANDVPEAKLIDCTNSRSNPGRQGVECFWGNALYFGGWISSPGTAGNKSGPYRNSLQFFLF